ncbi:MAG: UDP-N-acetylglucosamine 2-epimerase (non-hydrolyzing) [Holosporaceae bacterium]|nr:UDP-N-acetylglucosamine 2-epimerase (non-hydrolyzing) [Holosporaceae bacterium]
MRIMTIVGTRPEIIKLAQTIKQLDKFTDHILVHTGQNFDYELNEIFFRDLEIRKPDYFLEVADKNLARTIANVISKSDEVMEKESPDAVLLYGDTNSCLAAISAKRRKIPVFHMEAGNRCFDQRVPEEINRKIVDHLADINMVLTEHARRYLIREGIPQETIIKTGSSMKELLNAYASKIDASQVLQKFSLEEKKYFVVSAHREENVDNEQNLLDLIDSLDALIERYNYPVIFSTHPRTRAKLANLGGNFNRNIIFSKPFGFFDYLKSQKSAFCTISDSGTITEESSLLKFPAVTIRQQHERPEGMDEGVLIMCGTKKDMVLEAVKVVTQQPYGCVDCVDDYDVCNVSTKVVRIIMSYVGYVNRTVWRKYV